MGVANGTHVLRRVNVDKGRRGEHAKKGGGEGEVPPISDECHTVIYSGKPV